MARQSMVEVQCDRCQRKEYRPSDTVIKKEGHPDLTLSFKGKQVLFDDLCEVCQGSVNNYVESIAKEVKSKSPKRGAKRKDRSPSPAPPPKPSSL